MESRVFLTFLFVGVLGAPASICAFPPGDKPQSSSPGRGLTFACHVDTADGPIRLEDSVEVPASGQPAELDQVIELPAPLAPIRLVRYLSRAKCAQEFVPDKTEGSGAGIEISIDGPTHSYQQWLVANDPERNRLISLIGRWRYMAVADRKQRDELFSQFEIEYTREPVLWIGERAGGTVRKMSAKVGTVQKFDDPKCKIRVLKYFPHFAMDGGATEPANLSEKPMNPAVLVEVAHDGQKREHWVFARFPDFKVDQSAELPFRITLDCPPQRRDDLPDFALISIGRSGHELWKHEGDRHIARPIKVDERVEVPPSPYTFCVAKFIPSGRLVENYVSAGEKRGVAALKIRTVGKAGGEIEIWLEKGKNRVIPTVLGPMTVGFGGWSAGHFGG